MREKMVYGVVLDFGKRFTSSDIVGDEVSEVKLILGDCLVEMKKIPDRSIDLVLTDPPYGIGADKGVGGGHTKRA